MSTCGSGTASNLSPCPLYLFQRSILGDDWWRWSSTTIKKNYYVGGYCCQLKRKLQMCSSIVLLLLLCVISQKSIWIEWKNFTFILNKIWEKKYQKKIKTNRGHTTNLYIVLLFYWRLNILIKKIAYLSQYTQIYNNNNNNKSIEIYEFNCVCLSPHQQIHKQNRAHTHIYSEIILLLLFSNKILRFSIVLFLLNVLNLEPPISQFKANCLQITWSHN